MLFLTEKLLETAGFKYDDIEDKWVVPVLLRPVVTVECDEDWAYVVEALLEVHTALQSAGCMYKNYAINHHYLSVVGLAATDVAIVV